MRHRAALHRIRLLPLPLLLYSCYRLPVLFIHDAAPGTPRARRVYELGVQIGLWQHVDQRPSTMTPGLRGLPWWDKTQIWFSKLIEDSYPVIREEMLHAMTLPRCATRCFAARVWLTCPAQTCGT